MKRISLVGKKPYFVAVTAITLAFAGVVYAQGGTSGQGASGASATGGSTDQGFSNNKEDNQADTGRDKKGGGTGIMEGIRDNPTRGGTEKSLGTGGDRSGTGSGARTGAGSGSSSGTGGSGY